MVLVHLNESRLRLMVLRGFVTPSSPFAFPSFISEQRVRAPSHTDGCPHLRCDRDECMAAKRTCSSSSCHPRKRWPCGQRFASGDHMSRGGATTLRATLHSPWRKQVGRTVQVRGEGLAPITDGPDLGVKLSCVVRLP